MAKKKESKPKHTAVESFRDFFVDTGRWLVLLPAVVLAVSRVIELPFIGSLPIETKWMIVVSSFLASGIMDLLRQSIYSSRDTKRLLGELKETAASLAKHKLEIRGYEDVHDYLAYRLKSVRYGIRVIDTTPGLPGLRNDLYLEERKKITDSGKFHDRITLVRTEDDLLEVIESVEVNSSTGYRVGCFLETEAAFPLFSVIIIDEDEVHLGAGWLGDPARASFDIGIESQEVAHRFIDYFNILFEKSTTIKDRHGVNHDEINSLREEIGRQSPVVINRTGYPNHEKLLESIRQSHRLDIVSFPRLLSAKGKRKAYYAELRDSIVKRGLHHRRVIWNKDHALFISEWLKNDEELRKSENLEIRYFSPADDKHLFYFDLLDRESVILAQDLMGESWVQINDARFAELMEDYFMTLWVSAEKNWIKDSNHDGDDVNFDLLEEIQEGDLDNRVYELSNG